MDMTDVAVRQMNYVLLSQELNTLYVAGLSTGHHTAHDRHSPMQDTTDTIWNNVNIEDLNAKILIMLLRR